MLGPVLETLIGGLLTGVLYSLVALGFVLIFKASGVFNFAQGAMVLFAALSLARLSEVMPLAVALAPLGRDHDRARLCDRVPGAAPSRQSGGHHPVHGDARDRLFPRRLRPDDLGQRHLQDQPGAAVESDLHSRIGVSRRAPDRSDRADRRDDLRGDGARARGLLPGDARRPGACARSPTITRPRSPSAFRSTRSGSWCGRSRASSRWSPA